MNYPDDFINKVICGDCIDVMRQMPDGCVDCCITSPPYFGLRDYGMGGQIGLEPTLKEYVEKMSMVFREVNRVLKDHGTLWLNLGDTYATGTTAPRQKARLVGNKQEKPRMVSRVGTPEGLKTKDLIGIPWRVAFALQADGWYLRQDIIWHKPNPMPESVTDRCTKAHEYVFLFSKSQKYYYNQKSISEPLSTAPHKPGNNKHPSKTAGPNDRGGNSQWDDTKERVWCKKGFRNKRSVWSINTQPTKIAHFATFPEKLIEPCILAGCEKKGTVLDPFGGSGTTGLISKRLHRKYILCELNPEYVEKIANKRLSAVQPVLDFAG